MTQMWTYSLSNNRDYYVIKHQHDTVSLQIQIYNRGRESYHSHKHITDMQEFFYKYFISCIDTGPFMLSNGSNSIILSCCLFFLYLFLVFSLKAAATQ